MDQFKFTTEVSNPIFTYYPPLSPIKGFVSIPHSGLDIPDEFHAYLAPDLLPATSPDGAFLKTPINEDVDYAVDSLVNINALQEAGIAVIVAKIHRVCIDLNREPNIAVFSWEYNTQGIKLISTQPSEEIRLKWIEQYHSPYFEFVQKIIQNIEKIKLGFVSLLDLHSMPSRPTGYHLKKNPSQDAGRRKDFCLSSLNGMSCQKSYITGFKEGLELQDYTVSINDPYFGGYVTQFMDQNFRGNVIQCEINRDIYMDENEKKMLEKKKVVKNEDKNLEKRLIVEDDLNAILTKVVIDVFVAFNTPFVQNQMVEADGEERDNIDAQFAFSF